MIEKRGSENGGIKEKYKNRLQNFKHFFKFNHERWSPEATIERRSARNQIKEWVPVAAEASLATLLIFLTFKGDAPQITFSPNLGSRFEICAGTVGNKIYPVDHMLEIEEGIDPNDGVTVLMVSQDLGKNFERCPFSTDPIQTSSLPVSENKGVEADETKAPSVSMQSIVADLESPSLSWVSEVLHRRETKEDNLTSSFSTYPIALCPPSSSGFQIKYDEGTQGKGFTVSSGGFGNRFGDLNDQLVFTGLHININNPNGVYTGTAVIQCLAPDGSKLAEKHRGFEIQPSRLT